MGAHCFSSHTYTQAHGVKTPNQHVKLKKKKKEKRKGRNWTEKWSRQCVCPSEAAGGSFVCCVQAALEVQDFDLPIWHPEPWHGCTAGSTSQTHTHTHTEHDMDAPLQHKSQVFFSSLSHHSRYRRIKVLFFFLLKWFLMFFWTTLQPRPPFWHHLPAAILWKALNIHHMTRHTTWTQNQKFNTHTQCWGQIEPGSHKLGQNIR